MAKCCWDPLATNNEIKCYYGIVTENTEKMPGYKIEHSNNYESAILKIDKIPLYLDKNNSHPKNGPVFAPKLKITVKNYTEYHFSIKIEKEENSIGIISFFQISFYQSLNIKLNYNFITICYIK